MAYAKGGHIHPTDHSDSVPAMLSSGCTLTNMKLTARICGTDYELGEMTIEVPTRPGREQPWLWEVADIEPVLAEALREAADTLDVQTRAEASDGT